MYSSAGNRTYWRTRFGRASATMARGMSTFARSSRGRSRGRTEGRRRSSPRDAPTRRRRPPPLGILAAGGGGDAPGLLEARGEGRDAAGIDTAGMSRGERFPTPATRSRSPPCLSRDEGCGSRGKTGTTSATADDDDEEPHCSRRRGRRSTMGAVVPDERDRFPVSQRTLDLKTEAFRVRLCVPRPRAPCVRPTNQPSAHPPVPRFPLSVRSELVGSSGPPSAATFATAITHALTKTHGVVGGAIPLDHLSFEPDEIGTKWGRGRDGHSCGCVGVARCHASDARKVRTALAVAGPDGTECRAAARRGGIVGRPRRRVRGEGPGDSIDCASVVA